MPTAYREQYLLFIYSEYGATIASNAKLISHGLQMQRTPDPANKATTVYFDDDGLNVVYSAMKGSLFGLWRAFIFRRETRASQIAITRLACHAYRENFPVIGGKPA